MQKHLQAYLQKGGGVEQLGAGEQPESHQPPPSPHIHNPRTEHSADDLRTGLFQYIQDSGARVGGVLYATVASQAHKDTK